MKDINQELFREAKKYIPGGVNSPVRSFYTVSGSPVFIRRGSGSKIYSESNKEYIDYCLSWGALILGHAHREVIKTISETIRKGVSFGTVTKAEIELAKIIVEAMPSIEKVRLTNSGTEAVMTAIRLARAFTKRDKIIKFEGSYHGHIDYLLVKRKGQKSILNIPSSWGVPQDFVKETILLPYNDIDILEKTLNKFHNIVAGIIIEPVLGNCGVILPKGDFLKRVRRLCDRYRVLLIFDEVITGFRLSYGGAQEYFQVRPDLTCLGKIIGGGLPVGAVGGRAKIMDLLSPQGSVYQAGTFAGNPVTVNAGITTLRLLKEINPYKDLENKCNRLVRGIIEKAKNYSINVNINHIGSMFSIFFINKRVENYRDALLQDTNVFKVFFKEMLKEGVYFSPSPWEANFLSIKHSDRDLAFTLNKVDKTFGSIIKMNREGGLI